MTAAPVTARNEATQQSTTHRRHLPLGHEGQQRQLSRQQRAGHQAKGVEVIVNEPVLQSTADLYVPFKASSSAGSKPFLFWRVESTTVGKAKRAPKFGPQGLDQPGRVAHDTVTQLDELLVLLGVNALTKAVLA